MGCFSVPKTRSSPEELPPTLKSLLQSRQHGLPPVRWIGENYNLLGSNPSFRARAKAIQSISRFVKSQPRTLSAPAVFHSVQNSEEENYNNLSVSISHSGPVISGSHREPVGCVVANSRHSITVIGSSAFVHGKGGSPHSQITNPLFPLPLPPEDRLCQSVSSTGSVSSVASSSSVNPASTSAIVVVGAPTQIATPASLTWGTYSSEPMPLPPPPDSGAAPREFSLEELTGACQNFSSDFLIRNGGAGPVYSATVKKPCNEEKLEVAVTRLLGGAGSISFKKWRAEVNSLTRMSHPHLCKVIGFCAEPQLTDQKAIRRKERLLVYENTSNGSVDRLLYSRTDRAPLDWSARMKIALGIAQGLAYLHERTPKQVRLSASVVPFGGIQNNQDTIKLHRDRKSSRVLLFTRDHFLQLFTFRLILPFLTR
eukprot:c16795_g1_i2 orf=1132-2409(-)